MSRIAEHVAAAIATGLGKHGAAQAKVAGSPQTATVHHVAKAIAASRQQSTLPVQPKQAIPFFPQLTARIPGRQPRSPPRFLPRSLQQVERPRTAQELREEARKNEAKFLHETSAALFSEVKKVAGNLTEVQSSIFDGRLFISSNYTALNDGSLLKGKLPEQYVHNNITYKKADIVRVAGIVHAEQAILLELAKVIANPNKKNPRHVSVIGSKRPCSNCRRTLIAFNRALQIHYPTVNLHWIDQTGTDTEGDNEVHGAPISLDALAAGYPDDKKFAAFAATYSSELAKVRLKALSGEEVSNSERTAAVPDLADLF